MIKPHRRQGFQRTSSFVNDRIKHLIFRLSMGDQVVGQKGKDVIDFRAKLR